MGTLGLLWAFAGGVASVHLLIWLQDSRLGLRRAPSLLATAVFALAVFTIAHEGCQNVGAQPATGRRVLATTFTHMKGPYAKWNGRGFACWKMIAPPGVNKWAPWGTKTHRYVKMNGNEWGVAHRTLPCGTMVKVSYKGRTVIVPVLDRGPWWATPKSCLPKFSHRCWKKGRSMVKLRSGWRYMNELDLTILPSASLGFPGMGVVEYRRR